MVQRRTLCTALAASGHPIRTYCGVQFLCVLSVFRILNFDHFHGSSETIIRVSSLSFGVASLVGRRVTYCLTDAMRSDVQDFDQKCPRWDTLIFKKNICVRENKSDVKNILLKYALRISRCKSQERKGITEFAGNFWFDRAKACVKLKSASVLKFVMIGEWRS